MARASAACCSRLRPSPCSGLGLNLTPCVYPLDLGRPSPTSAASRAAVATPRGSRPVVRARHRALVLRPSAWRPRSPAACSAPRCRNRPCCCSSPRSMIVLALGSFGALPAASRRRSWCSGARAARRLAPPGALFMGLTMGIVAAPCVGPIVVGLLIFVGSRQDAVARIPALLRARARHGVARTWRWR